MEANDGKETACGEKSAEEIKGIVTELSGRKGRYKTYVEALERSGETQKSLADPDGRLMAANGEMEARRNARTAAGAKNKLVVEFEVANERTDHNQITPMAERTKTILGTESLTVVAHGAAPHRAGTDFDVRVPVPESEAAVSAARHNGRCVYIAGRNLAVCPMGKTLYPGFYKKATGRGAATGTPAKPAAAPARRKDGGGVIKPLWRRRTFQRSMMMPPACRSNKWG